MNAFFQREPEVPTDAEVKRAIVEIRELLKQLVELLKHWE